MRPSVPLKLNRLSPVKSPWRQWRTCPFWCSLANALRATRWRGVRIKPTNGRLELNSLLWSRFLKVWSEICTPVPREKSLCRERAVLRLNRLGDKKEIPVQLTCCGPSAPLSSYARVLASLSKSPPSTRVNTWGYPEPSCDPTHGWTILEQLDGLGNFTMLQLSHDVYRGRNSTKR